ncbi:MAG: tetratricopeptide repeat protein [Bacteroidia bacterium]
MVPKLKEYISQGKASYEARDFEIAYQQLSLAVGIYEENGSDFYLNEEEIAEVYLLRGSSLYYQGERDALHTPEVFGQVIDDYDQAVDIRPNNPLYRNIRGKLYLNCQFASFEKEARADFLEVLKLNPQNSFALKSLGEIASREEAYDQAIHYFSKALEAGEDKEIFMLRGVCHFRKNNPDFRAAAEDFGKAQAFLPRLEELYVWRAQCFAELGDVYSAIAEYDKLTEISPSKAGFFVDRGALKIAIDPEGALEDFNQALEIAPHPLAYNNRAYYHLLRGNYQAAIEDAKKALAVDGQRSIAYATLAEIYATMEDDEQFFHYLELAMKYYYDDVVDVLLEPAFEPYTSDPRFIQLVGRNQ